MWIKKSYGWVWKRTTPNKDAKQIYEMIIERIRKPSKSKDEGDE